MKKRLKIGLMLVIVGFLSMVQAAEVVDQVVAVVNDNVITQSQLDERIQSIKKTMPPGANLPKADVLRKQVLEEEINRVLQLDMAKTLGIKVTDEQVATVVVDIAKRNGLTLVQMKEKLQEEGISYDRYMQEIHDQLLIHKLQQQTLVPIIQVSNQEVSDYLRHAPATPVKTNGRYHVLDYFIALPETPSATELEQARNLAAHIRANLSAYTVQTQDPAVQVIDLGWRKAEALPLLFQPVVEKMSLREVSSPIQAKNGLHIIKLVEVDEEAPGKKEELHLREIVLKEDPLNNSAQIRSRFLQLRARLAAGEDFASMARAVSQDPQSSVEGGDLGWLRAGMYDPDLEAATRTLQLGELSQPVKTQRGWVLVQVMGRRAIQDKQALREAEARDAVFRRKLDEKLQEWLKQARAQAYVKVF
ncbi:MAG: peptidylprolyl isomerase [Gammaproteobacteria bacterium]|nr:peptidylprolyl isomerase [Gammaproteobacteria bacterium]